MDRSHEDDAAELKIETGYKWADVFSPAKSRLAHLRGTAKQWRSLPKDDQELKLLYLNDIKHPSLEIANHAMKIKRSTKQAFIFLVGVSGAGKSSTINYFFDREIATTNRRQSQTSACVEYIVEMKSEAWKVPDMRLSVVDTPGFCDTKSPENDARNLLSIKKFIESHSYLKGCFPNLVMIVHSINDNRTLGDQAKFEKMLKGISYIDIIDKKCHNVVVVLTHAATVARNPEIWKRKTTQFKLDISEIVRKHLGFNPDIVVQENEPEENMFTRLGDWHILPDNEKQPKQLFIAIKELLYAIDDDIGYEAMAICFRRGMVQTLGQVTKADAVGENEIQKMMSMLLPENSFANSELNNRLDKYATDHQDKTNDIHIIKERLRTLELNRMADIQSLSLNDLVKKFRPTCISKGMVKIFKEVFSLAFDQEVRFDSYVGKSFNLMHELVSPFTALNLVYDDPNKLGVPINIAIRECCQTKVTCTIFENDRQYVKQRLKSLNVHLGYDFKIGAFQMQKKSGYNKQHDGFFNLFHKLDKQSFLIEHRTKKVEATCPFELSNELIADIPDDFDKKCDENIQKWKVFIDKWGTHAITGSFEGGSIVGSVTSELKSNNDITRLSTEVLNLKLSCWNFEDKIKSDLDDKLREYDEMLQFTSLCWNGGATSFYKNFKEINGDDWKQWIKSLEISPVPLSTSLDLVWLYNLVPKPKCIIVKNAFEYFLKDEPEIKENVHDFKSDESNWQNKCPDPEPEPEPDTRDSNGKSKESEDHSCFHEDSILILSTGMKKRIKDIAVGDKVISMDNNGYTQEDTIIAWLHREENESHIFLDIVHDFGVIRMSKNHIILIGEKKIPIRASKLTPGQKICFFQDLTQQKSPDLVTVYSIKTSSGQGIYAPLTLGGYLIVDGLAVSCYCSIDSILLMGKEILSSQTMAHIAFLPLRIAFWLGMNLEIGKSDRSTGIHSYAKWLIDHTPDWLKYLNGMQC